MFATYFWDRMRTEQLTLGEALELTLLEYTYWKAGV